MEHFWDWAKVNAIDGAGDLFTGPEHCTYSEKKLWSELGKIIWRNHQNTFQDHVEYIHNNIVNPFRVVIIHYAERVREMHDLAKYLPPLSMKKQE